MFDKELEELLAKLLGPIDEQINRIARQQENLENQVNNLINVADNCLTTLAEIKKQLK